MTWKIKICFCCLQACVLAALCALPIPVLAQPEGVHSLDLPETLKLSRLVDLTAECTGQKYTYQASELDAVTVTLRGMKTLTVNDLPETLNQILANHRYTTVRTPDSVMLTVTKIEAAAAISKVYEEGLPDAGYGTIMLQARNRTSQELAEAIKPLLSGGGAGKADAVGKTAFLLVSDTTPRLKAILRFAKRVDTPDLNVVRTIELRNSDATQVAASANSVVGKKGEGSTRRLQGDLLVGPTGRTLILVTPPESEQAWRDLIVSFDINEPPSTQTYQPRNFAAADVAKLIGAVLKQPGGGTGSGPSIVVDELTESLIITGTASDHARAQELLERLDSQERLSKTVRSFPIKNRPVGELLATLRQLIDSGLLDEELPSTTADDVARGALQRQGRAPAPPAGSTPIPATGAIGNSREASTLLPAPLTTYSASSPLSLSADESTNTLIAIGEPRLLAQLEKMLQTLDVRQPQVMLEVVLVTLTETQTVSFGAELDRITALGNSALRLSSLFGLGTTAVGAAPPAVGAGFTGAVLNPGEFSFVVRALETINAGNSVSHPQVLVTNNEQAQFSSTVQQPIRQLTRSNTSDQTFSYGGTESAGTTISVKPQIAQGDHLVLTYSVNLSSFIGTSADPGVPPPKQDNSVRSVATIPDGHTVVVGGLELLNDSDARSRLPLIGRIPLLGQILGTTNDTSGRTRFFVFIKATVLRSSQFEDLKYLSSMKATEMDIDDGFPEVTPRVIR